MKNTNEEIIFMRLRGYEQSEYFYADLPRMPPLPTLPRMNPPRTELQMLVKTLPFCNYCDKEICQISQISNVF